MSRTPTTNPALFQAKCLTRALRALRLPILLVVSALGVATRANAQSLDVGARAMPALMNVGVPVPAEHRLALAGSIGGAYLDPIAAQTAALRATAGVALAFSPLPQFTLAADVAGRRDGFGDGTNWYGEPRLGARFATALSATQFIGAMLDARFVGAEAPSIEWQATTPALRGSYGARLGSQTWLGLEAGFELDRTKQALPHLSRMTETDKRTVAASSWNGLPLGLGVAHGFGRGWQLLGEVSGRWLVGAERPAISQSPWRVSAGVRHRFSPSWVAQLGVEAALSARDSLPSDQTLPREPRVAGWLAVAWTMPNEVATPKVQPKVVAPPKPTIVTPAPIEAPQAPATAPVSGTLVDEGGRPIADAEVVLLRDGVELSRQRTTAEGAFAFERVTLGAVVLRVNESGYEPLDVQLSAQEPRTAELVLLPAVPAGQVRGKVLDLYGNPVMAAVTVNPGELSITVAVDGSFELDLAPGRYTVRFEHPSFAPQRRIIVVKDRAVVILNIGLVR